jgi:O-antigen/teichoic acid export membrane protein
VTAAVVVVFAARHLVLAVFGPEYADRGDTVLLVLALGTFGVAVNCWTLMRLRLARQLRASVLMQAVTCAATLGIAAVGVSVSLVAVATAWGLGQLAGGVVGLVAVVAHPRGARP